MRRFLPGFFAWVLVNLLLASCAPRATPSPTLPAALPATQPATATSTPTGGPAKATATNPVRAVTPPATPQARLELIEFYSPI